MGVIHQAQWLMVDPQTWIHSGAVEVEGGRVTWVGKAPRHRPKRDWGEGVLMPPLANTHTHLSLSALRQRIQPGAGFLNWVEQVIALRETLGEEEVQAEALMAAREMRRVGTGLVGEVGAWDSGKRALEQAGLRGVVFQEGLGADPEIPPLPGESKGVLLSYAAHGPHTTSPRALCRLKEAAQRHHRILSIHLAESREETEFLATGTGAWARLMARRGHSVQAWEPWGERPVKRAGRLGILGEGTLAVHLLEVVEEEVELLKRTCTRVCLCPRSNLVLHGRLPGLPGLLRAGLEPALGTDSLASVPTLSLWDEMRFVVETFREIRPETILAMATLNGARALGFSKEGCLHPGALGQMIHVARSAPTASKAAEALVWSGGPSVTWIPTDMSFAER